MIETNRGEWDRLERRLEQNGSIYYEFDTFTETWGNLGTYSNILRRFEARQVELWWLEANWRIFGLIWNQLWLNRDEFDTCRASWRQIQNIWVELGQVALELRWFRDIEKELANTRQVQSIWSDVVWERNDLSHPNWVELNLDQENGFVMGTRCN